MTTSPDHDDLNTAGEAISRLLLEWVAAKPDDEQHNIADLLARGVRFAMLIAPQGEDAWPIVQVVRIDADGHVETCASYQFGARTFQ